MSKPETRRRRRRRVLPGFPVESAFGSLEQVDEYLGGAKIVCLLCGRAMNRLAIHLPSIHDISEDEYRLKYGLPWGRGLTSRPTHERYSAATQRRVDDGSIDFSIFPSINVVAKTATKRRNKFKAEIAVRNLEVANAAKSGEDALLRKARRARIARDGPRNRGEKSPLSKYPDALMLEALRQLAVPGVRQKDVAASIGCSVMLISMLARGLIRRDLLTKDRALRATS